LNNQNNAISDLPSVFVGDIGQEVTAPMLEAVFRDRFSSVDHAHVVMDPATGKNKGFGFVRFRESREADLAMQSMGGTVIGSRAIRVGSAQTKKPGTVVQSQIYAGYQPGYNVAPVQPIPIQWPQPMVPFVPSKDDLSNIDNKTAFFGNLDPMVSSEQLHQ